MADVCLARDEMETGERPPAVAFSAPSPKVHETNQIDIDTNQKPASQNMLRFRLGGPFVITDAG